MNGKVDATLGTLSCTAVVRRRTRCWSNCPAAGGCGTRSQRSRPWNRRSPPSRACSAWRLNLALTAWDSALVTFLLELLDVGAQRQMVVAQELPRGVETAVAPGHRRAGAPGGPPGGHPSAFLDRIGQGAGLIASVGDLLGFIGEAMLALGNFVRGRAASAR